MAHGQRSKKILIQTSFDKNIPEAYYVSGTIQKRSIALQCRTLMVEQKQYKHIFAVAAYGMSPYLPKLLYSLKQQSVESKIIICTSTPNSFITKCSARFSVPVYVRSGEHGLKNDWNFAYEEASKLAPLVTIAHQDDQYFPDYTKELLEAYRKYPDLSVFCCRYDTIDAEGNTIPGSAEAVKRLLRLRLRNHRHADRSAVKLSALKWGNGIGCPTCTYNREFCPSPLFQNDYKFVIDWETLVGLAKAPGRFICIEKPLMAYRVHQGAETMRNIENHNREKEEREMFEKLHSRPMAALLMHFYKKAANAYTR